MAAQNTVGIAILSMVIIAGGYAVIAGLWYLMVYRPSRDERRAADAARRSEAAGPDADGRS